MTLSLPRLLTLLLLVLPTSWAAGYTGEEIQKFLDEAVAAGGGEVVLPPGRHRLERPLVIKDAEKLRLIGLEAEETWLLPAEDVKEPFPLLVIEGKVKEVRLIKLTWSTRGSAVEWGETPLVRVAGKGEQRPSVAIDRCLFEKHPGAALSFSDAVDCEVTACVFMDLKGEALRVSGGSSGLLFRHNHLTRCGDPAVVLADSTSNCRLLANEWAGLRVEVAGEGHQLSDNDS